MSSVSVRIFFITDEDEILKVPIAKFERMLKGSYEEKAERFAGKRIRAAEIAVTIDKSKLQEGFFCASINSSFPKFTCEINS